MKEKNILQQQNHEQQQDDLSSSSWIVSLWAAFYDTQHLYLVMELCRGDLQGLIDQQKQQAAEGSNLNNNNDNNMWSQHSVPYYASQILEAVQYLHEVKRIIHCNLKPHNLLQDASKGKIKLTYFSCAIEILMVDSTLTSSKTIPDGTTPRSYQMNQ
jgi:serine/threonine protein kinase